ncbi:MAG: ribonuclease P protein component [Mucilaginibacter polytrichastri]|nr:ribonuclease P protein component [Mucilaginibacter polytrichastri]
MFTFPKEERLCNKRRISALYHSGSSFLVYPIRVQWQPAGAGEALQVLFSVPKRHFKKAVMRNLLKRRMREAYRLQRDLSGIGNPLTIAFHYVAKEELPYHLIEKKMLAVLKKIGGQTAPKRDEPA